MWFDEFDYPCLENLARVKVFGVGKAAIDAVNHLLNHGLGGIEFITADTDQNELSNSLAPTRILLKEKHVDGARTADNLPLTEESICNIKAALDDADIVFITADMGNETGTSVIPVISSYAREAGVLVIAIITMPSVDEGDERTKTAQKGIAELKNNVDTIIRIPKENLTSTINSSNSHGDTIDIVNDMIHQCIKGIAHPICLPTRTSIELDDFKKIFANSGEAFIGIGTATKENATINAVKIAINALAQQLNLNKVYTIFLNITITDEDTATMSDVYESIDFIKTLCSTASINYAITHDETLNDSITTTIMATNLY